MEALHARLKSEKSIHAALKHVNEYVAFTSDLQLTMPKATLVGFDSHVTLRRFLEGRKQRGKTVPASARAALDVWADALSVSLQLKRKAVLAECQYERGHVFRQAPFSPKALAERLEEKAKDSSGPLMRRAYAAGFLLMTYASFRFADTKHLGEIKGADTSFYGALE